MKVGILTWVNMGRNCGQILQLFALQEAFKQDGIFVTVINYKLHFKKHWRNKVLYHPRLMWQVITDEKSFLKQVKFDVFVLKYLKTGGFLFSPEQVSRFLRKRKIFNLVVGSDQVWNPNIGIDDVYLCRFEGVFNKFSYSPSMCSVSMKDTYRDEIKHIANSISDFKYVGVREEGACELLREYSNKDIQVLLDPVYLLDNSEWDSRFKIRHNLSKNIVVCSYYKKTEGVIRYVDKFKGDREIQKVYFIQRDNDDVVPAGWNSLIDISPTEFVSYISNSSLLICDSFHAMSFALIYRVPFLVLDFEDKEKSTMFRCSELLEKIGLSDRYIVDSECDFDSMNFDISPGKDFVVTNTMQALPDDYKLNQYRGDFVRSASSELMAQEINQKNYWRFGRTWCL